MSINPEKINHLPPGIQRLVRLVESQRTDITPERARDFVIEANVQTEDVMPWADFGHPARDGYGRKPAYDGGFFEIMVMSWTVGDFSSIHDHGTAQWGAVKSFGNAEHAVFEFKNDTLVTRVRNAFSPGTVNPVTHDLIHQMGNVDQAPFCSLHMYGSYDHNGDITGDSRIYDLYENKVQFTTGGVFFCLPESDISDRETGVKADYPTFLRHHAEMLKRIHTFLPHLRDEEEQQRFRKQAEDIRDQLFSASQREWFLRDMAALTDDEGRVRDMNRWNIFWNEVRVAADLKARYQDA
ncbi:MAG: cysteine dioxygenase family protein [Acidobacteriota bacterium]|nr:cysteine dioxygenase family protein [Acidobacteriota bacterium]